ncbi:hypothetical protein ULMS_17340 [Patiriisocius marinistellae]|uniref:Uncharacterized protein n=1 Tax=Patiriisocius marinistellae TaxID=2494560 RepID=A0A5J4G151_9FLAO|nr:hypothetical protein [Patiriisocius marinistellae]GEQ86226.1 hypothetical protein ULMS_17340 [Patiriisocius marinistellae]
METLINLILAAALHFTSAQAAHQQKITQQLEMITPQEICCEITTQVGLIKNEHINNNTH